MNLFRGLIARIEARGADRYERNRSRDPYLRDEIEPRKARLAERERRLVGPRHGNEILEILDTGKLQRDRR